MFFYIFGSSFTPNFKYNKNGAYDICMARYALKAAVQASEILGVNGSERERWKRYDSELPDYPTYGTGDEKIFVDMENAPPIEYNLPAPIITVFPGEDHDQVRTHRDIYIRTLDSMRFNFYDAVTLGIIGMRLELPDALERFRVMLKRTALPNGYFGLLPEYHPYNNFHAGFATQSAGLLAPLCDMLLQSHDNAIRLFPAYGRVGANPWEDQHPAAFKQAGAFKSLRAQGAFLVSSTIYKRVVGETEITSLAGNECRIYSEWKSPVVLAENVPVTFEIKNNILRFATETGKNYVIRENVNILF